ncbi:hypothetical protein PYCC9005_000332 [Savitreella phatthalungensis]
MRGGRPGRPFVRIGTIVPQAARDMAAQQHNEASHESTQSEADKQEAELDEFGDLNGWDIPETALFDALHETTNMPPEVCVEVMDKAMRWAVHRSGRKFDNGPLRISNKSVLVIKSPSISEAGLKALRRIRIRVKAHDQGWSSENTSTQGTFEGSHTWHDISFVDKDILTDDRVDSDTLDGTLLHYNRHASSSAETFEQVFDVGSDFIEALPKRAPGTRSVGLISSARYPGWTNHVVAAEIELFFAATFDDDSQVEQFLDD